MPWYQSKPHIWRNFLVFVAISQIWQENFSKYVVWIGTKAYIWRPYYLTIWRILRKLYIRIYKYMPWYHYKPHIWRYFLVFVVISQIWHIKIHPNSHRLTVLVLSYYLLYTRYPIVARALGLAAARPRAECVARAKVSCIQTIWRVSRKSYCRI